MPEIASFPAHVLRNDTWKNEHFVWIDGLQEQFEACYDQHLLPSEMETIAWAKSGEIVPLRNYHIFPSDGSGITERLTGGKPRPRTLWS